MKIVHICLCGPYNDYWGYQDNLIPKYNVQDGHEVTVITSTFINSLNSIGCESVDHGEYTLKTGEKVIRLPLLKNNLLFEKLRVYKGLEEHLEYETPDLIFMHGLQFGNMREVIKYIKKHPKCRLVADNHASYDNSAQNFLSKYILHKIIWRKNIRKAVPYFNKVFMIAPGCKEFAIDMYSIPEEKMEYLYLGADTERIKFESQVRVKMNIRQSLNIDEDDFVLITGGKLTKGKNTELLLKSIRKIKNKKIKLIIFGAFSDDIKHEMLNLIKLDDRVRFIGWLNGEDVYDYYLASDIAVFPGTKSALWEQAICSGLPLICKRWKGMEYVDVGGNCIFIDDCNVEHIAEKIEVLINDKHLYNNMKQIAKTKGFEKFSYERIAQQAININ